MIHKAFPGGIADLREYVYELEGRKDSWVKAVNADGKYGQWSYAVARRPTDVPGLLKTAKQRTAELHE